MAVMAKAERKQSNVELRSERRAHLSDAAGGSVLMTLNTSVWFYPLPGTDTDLRLFIASIELFPAV